MSLVEVARKDFLDTRRTKTIWLVLSIYAGFAALIMYINIGQWQYYDTLHQAVIQTMSGLVFVGSVLIPVVALVAAYLAIAGERETGSAKFLLGLPNTRREVILGKFLSRSFIIALGVVSAFLIIAGFLLSSYPVFPVIPYLVMFGLTLLYAIAYVAIAIGLSASVASKARAAAAAFGLYFLLNIVTLVQSPAAIVRTLHADILGFNEAPALYQFISQLVPSQALTHGISVVNAGMSGSAVPSGSPFYLQAEFMPVTLCGWIVAPLIFGYYRFRTADVS